MGAAGHTHLGLRGGTAFDTLTRKLDTYLRIEARTLNASETANSARLSGMTCRILEITSRIVGGVGLAWATLALLPVLSGVKCVDWGIVEI